MGKKDNKKKGKGAEKTAAKTEKKTTQKIKKNLKAKGEEDIDTLLAQFAEADSKQQQIIEELCKQPPSKRSAFSLTPHPDKDQLVILGGEHFNGTQTLVYNELFTYTIKQDRWHRISSPGGPPPRCSHQAVAVQQNGGELWVFGGEFTSKSQSQFYHYKDLWVFSFANKSWRKVLAAGGPSSRSGHRMVVAKKKLFVFGGFHDNGYNYNYFNDLYCFDLETYKWTKLEPTGKLPSPRSACGLAALSDGRLLVFGGYSREKQQGKKSECGVTHTDMFHLVPDKHDTTGSKYKWVAVKQSGDVPAPQRCSFSFTASGDDRAVLFGGVNDTEAADDDDIEGQFFDELVQLDMTRGSWTELYVTGKKSTEEEKKRRRRNKDDIKEGDGSETDEEGATMEVSERLDSLAVEQPQQTVVTDGVFTLTQTVGTSSAEASSTELGASLLKMAANRSVFVPPPRISGGVAVRKGVLYLYGGLYEEEDKQLTLNDFYSLDLSKLEEWRIIKPLDPKDLEWFESESEEEDEEEEEEEEEEDDDEDMSNDGD